MTTTTKLGKMLENGKLVLMDEDTESQSWTTTSWWLWITVRSTLE